VEVSLPAELVCRLTSATANLEVVAARVDPAVGIVAVPAGSYLKALYALDLPIILVGNVRLDVPELGNSGVAFTIDDTPPSLAEAAPAPVTELQDAQKIDMDSFIHIYQPYARNIFFYQPMYFLVGVAPEETKFQLSFKYRLFNPEKGISQKHPWVPNIFLGYTQTSFWDLASDSLAFEDTSYKPEIFHQTQNMATGRGLIKGLFLQTGFQHESNGQGGDESRNTNYLYMEPSLIFLEEKEVLGLRIAPRFWLYVDNSEDSNPDIEDYRGYFDLGLTFGKASRFILDNHFRWAKEGASFEVNLTYPLHRLLRDNIDLYLHVQYANVLGESLLHYTERTEAVRIGLAIVR
jgi:outer membrane phospholipase A